MRKLVFAVFMFPVSVLAGGLQLPDTSYLLSTPQIVYIHAPTPSRSPAEAFEDGAKIGQAIGQAIRARKARKKREAQLRVNAATALCGKLRPAILAGDNLALEACVGILLE